MTTLLEIPDLKIRSRIEIRGECWIWTGSLNNNGYGHFVRGTGKKVPRQKKSYVHRYTFELFKGAVPAKHEVHHSCYNRPCCNPDHLMAVSHALNVAFNRQLA